MSERSERTIDAVPCERVAERRDRQSAHRASDHAFLPTGQGRLVRLVLAGALGIAIFGGAAYGGSRLLAGDVSGPGRAAPADAAPAAGPDVADEEAPAYPGSSESSTAAAPSPSSAAPSPSTAKPTPTSRRSTAAGGGGSAQEGGSAPVAEVLRLVNAERAKAGCGALTTDSRLAAAATAHSQDMAANDYFSHTGRNGSTVVNRIEAKGYTRWSAVAENIAKGQQTPASVMQAWMTSDGHRKNILNCGYRNIGIGLAYAGRTPYWTQDFATPR